jgi:hypothetical protein
MPSRILRRSVPSLRGRLGVLVLAVAVPTLVLVAVLTKRAYDHERAAVSRHLANTTRAIAVLIERKFESAEALLRGLGILQSLERGDLTEFERRVRNTRLDANEWIMLIEPTGR